jgi:hypothetical protein
MLRSTGAPSRWEVVKLGGSLLTLPDWPMHVAELVRERAAERPVLLVVGGGYIAVEFASVFARLGSEVHQAMRADNVLRGFDADMRNGVRDAVAFALTDRLGEPLHVRVQHGDATALAVGSLMNARGLMELIIINIGLKAGVIGQPLFSILVVMAIVTTLMATPLFEVVYGRNSRKNPLPADAIDA